MNRHLNAEEIKAFQEELAQDSGRTEMVQLFKLLGDATRLNIITLLTKREPLCVEDLMNCTGMEQSAISHQLKKLREHHIVKAEKVGKHVWYSLEDHHVLELYNLASEHCCEEHSA